MFGNTLKIVSLALYHPSDCPIASFTSFMARRRLLPYPTDIELFVVVFGIAPLIGQTLVGIYIAAGYYLIRLIIKLIVLSRPVLKEG